MCASRPRRSRRSTGRSPTGAPRTRRASATDMAGDWRIRMPLPTHRGLGWMADPRGARDLGRELASDRGDRIAWSRHHEELFLYAGSEASARRAEQVVRNDLNLRGRTAENELARWHEEAQEC